MYMYTHTVCITLSFNNATVVELQTVAIQQVNVTKMHSEHQTVN